MVFREQSTFLTGWSKLLRVSNSTGTPEQLRKWHLAIGTPVTERYDVFFTCYEGHQMRWLWSSWPLFSSLSCYDLSPQMQQHYSLWCEHLKSLTSNKKRGNWQVVFNFSPCLSTLVSFFSTLQKSLSNLFCCQRFTSFCVPSCVSPSLHRHTSRALSMSGFSTQDPALL